MVCVGRYLGGGGSRRKSNGRLVLDTVCAVEVCRFALISGLLSQFSFSNWLPGRLCLILVSATVHGTRDPAM